MDASQQNQYKKEAAKPQRSSSTNGMIVGLGTGTTAAYLVSVTRPPSRGRRAPFHRRPHIGTHRRTSRSLGIPLATLADINGIDSHHRRRRRSAARHFGTD